MHGRAGCKQFETGAVQIGHMDCNSVGVFNMSELNKVRTNEQISLISQEFLSS